MKYLVISLSLLCALNCFAQPATKNIHIIRPKEFFSNHMPMKLLVNGRAVTIARNSFVTIPLSTDSVRIETADKRCKKWSTPVAMTAKNENYFFAYYDATKKGWPHTYLVLQPVDQDCFDKEKEICHASVSAPL